MADRPMATAPDRSVAALSTMVILIFLGLAQRAPSKAAPQQAMPPPIRRRSVSTVSISGFLQNENVQVSFSIYPIPPYFKTGIGFVVVKKPGCLIFAISASGLPL